MRVPDEHVPQGQEVVMLQIIHLNDSPGILSPAYLLAAHLYHRVTAHHCKRHSVLLKYHNKVQMEMSVMTRAS